VRHALVDRSKSPYRSGGGSRCPLKSFVLRVCLPTHDSLRASTVPTADAYGSRVSCNTGNRQRDRAARTGQKYHVQVGGSRRGRRCRREEVADCFLASLCVFQLFGAPRLCEPSLQKCNENHHTVVLIACCVSPFFSCFYSLFCFFFFLPFSSLSPASA